MAHRNYIQISAGGTDYRFKVLSEGWSHTLGRAQSVEQDADGNYDIVEADVSTKVWPLVLRVQANPPASYGDHLDLLALREETGVLMCLFPDALASVQVVFIEEVSLRNMTPMLTGDNAHFIAQITLLEIA